MRVGRYLSGRNKKNEGGFLHELWDLSHRHRTDSAALRLAFLVRGHCLGLGVWADPIAVHLHLDIPPLGSRLVGRRECTAAVRAPHCRHHNRKGGPGSSGCRRRRGGDNWDSLQAAGAPAGSVRNRYRRRRRGSQWKFLLGRVGGDGAGRRTTAFLAPAARVDTVEQLGPPGNRIFIVVVSAQRIIRVDGIECPGVAGPRRVVALTLFHRETFAQ